jgi:hypothetical protein
MAAAAELDPLLVRILGDASSYLRSLSQAQAATKSFVASTVSGFASLAGFGQLKSFFSLFGEQAGAERRLTAAIEGNGRAVGGLLQEYTAFAAAMQRVTVLGDQTTLGLLRTAEAFGLSGAAAENAVQTAIALSGAVTGSAESAASYLRIAVALQQGNIELVRGMARLVPQLRGAKTDAELLARAHRLVEIGMRTVAGEANSTAGQIKALFNDFRNFKEELGRIVADAIGPYIQSARNIVAWLQRQSDATKIFIVQVFAVGAAVATIGPALAVLRLLTSPITSLIRLGITLVATTAGLVLLIAKQVVSIALWTIWNSVVLTFNATLAVFKFLLGGTTVGTVLWLAVCAAVNGVMAAWTGIMFLVNASLGIYKALMAGGTFVTLAFNVVKAVFNALMVTGIVTTALSAAKMLILAAATLIAKAAVWLLNAAITALYSILGVGVAVILALGATLYIVAEAAAYAAAALWGAYSAAGAVFEVLSNIPTTSGPLAAVLNLFRDWGSIIYDVYKAAQVSLPLAWELLVQGARLAVSQVRDLWPRLWDVLADGFEALWKLAAAQFTLSFTDAFNRVTDYLAIAIETKLDDALGKALKNAVVILDAIVPGLKKTFDTLWPSDKDMTVTAKAALDKQQAQAKAHIEDAKALLEASLDNFSLPFDSDETKAAKNNIRGIMSVLDAALKDQQDKGNKDPYKLNDWAPAIHAASAAIHKFDAAATGSAEYFTRLEAYQDMLQYGSSKKGHGTSFEAAATGSAEAGTRIDATTGLLQQAVSRLDQLVQQGKKPGLNLKNANLKP